ncbi:MAG: hypothetical protein OSJ43_04340 [Oscillospiraceae bacterium]|nr:hypothetical protein [Oscillospiraceae bacterium]
MKKLPHSVLIFGFVDILFFFPIIWLIASVLCGISFVNTPPFAEPPRKRKARTSRP